MSRTTCEHCIFATRAKGYQLGCQFDKLSNFEIEMKGNSYEFDGICSTCRNVYWNKYSSETSMNKLKEEVYKEHHLPYVLIVNANKKPKSTIKGIITKVESVGYLPKHTFVMSVFNNRHLKDYQDLVNELGPDYSLNCGSQYAKLDTRLWSCVSFKNIAPFFLYINVFPALDKFKETMDKVHEDIVVRQQYPKCISGPKNNFVLMPKVWLNMHGTLNKAVKAASEDNSNNSEQE